MSMKTTTGTTNSYNPAGMSNYNQFQSTLGTGLQQYAQNPLGSSFFNNQLAASYQNAGALGQRNQANMFQNLKTGGGLIGNSGAYMQSQLNKNMLNTSSMQSNAFTGTLNNALQNQKWALSSMQGYTPLQTGQTSTQQQSSGIGGILGSLASAGLNFAAPGLGSMLGGGSFGGGYSQGTAATPSPSTGGFQNELTRLG